MNLIIGGNGGLGFAITKELLSKGKAITATYHQSKDSLMSLNGPLLTFAQLDIRDEESLVQLLKNTNTIYFCLNVPYQDWYSVMPQALERVTRNLKPAQVFVFPGNVYGYGKFQYFPADENHPKAAKTHKGKLRNELEEMLKAQAAKQGFRYVIPRYPDYYGPNVTNRMFGPIFTGALKAKPIFWPGKLRVPHDLIYIQDAAKAAVLLAESEESGEWHVSGAGAMERQQFLNIVQDEAGSPRKCRTLPALAVGLAGMFDKETKEFHELLYEFQYPLVLNDSKFTNRFPSYAATPHTEAVKETLSWFRANTK
ncbi:NAD-dependent epimerase/dehydratase family protein [Paenibacillus sp. BR2-3]|uniref:NAD-dependent epimerase/dehydratase family protein n=1 Tax=Paenibacillus sp. BR2-3 TaxID=3048494 RepID=UPI0039772F66